MLVSALKNENNKVMPYVKGDVKKLFYSLHTGWDVLQHILCNGEDIFKPVADRMKVAAGDKEVGEGICEKNYQNMHTKHGTGKPI